MGIFNFQFEAAPRIICELGASLQLNSYLEDCRHVFVVTDSGLVQAGIIEQPVAALINSGVNVTVYDGVKPDPSEHVVLAAAEAARSAGADCVVGFGGGSSLDTAKLVALLASTPQSLKDIYGSQQARGSRLRLIQVPTTAGTGSEVTPTAVVSTPDHQKKGVISRLLLPDVAVLDAGLIVTLPPATTATTGIDTMVHAIEAYTSRNRKNPLSDQFSIRSLQLSHTYMGRAIADGTDLQARQALLLSSLMAGIAFANSPVAAIHALAHPLGSHFHLPHGLANALVMMPVLRFNLPAAELQYAELARALHPELREATDFVAAEAFMITIAKHVTKAPIPQRLRDVDVRKTDLPKLVDAAMTVQRLLVNNPREVGYSDALQIYNEAY